MGDDLTEQELETLVDIAGSPDGLIQDGKTIERLIAKGFVDCVGNRFLLTEGGVNWLLASRSRPENWS